MNYNVINSGVIGNTSCDLCRRFASVAAEVSAGDTVVLLTGINDMLFPGHIISIDEYKENLLELINDFAACEVKTVLASVPEICVRRYFVAYPDSPVPDPAAALAAADAVIRETAAEKACRIWDIRKVLGNNMDYRLDDGMHLSPAGAEAAASALAETVKKVMKTGGTVLCLGDSLFYGPWLRGRGRSEPDGESVPSCLCRLLNS
jgi:lysophospholipase L1-like esterase